jgi:hypothetical protein
VDEDEDGDVEVDGHLKVEVKAMLDVAAMVVGKRASSDTQMDAETEADDVNAAVEVINGMSGDTDNEAVIQYFGGCIVLILRWVGALIFFCPCSFLKLVHHIM